MTLYRTGIFCIVAIAVGAALILTVELAFFGMLGDFWGFSYARTADQAASDVK